MIVLGFSMVFNRFSYVFTGFDRSFPVIHMEIDVNFYVFPKHFDL